MPKTKKEIEKDVAEIMGSRAYEGKCLECERHSVLGTEGVCKDCATSEVGTYKGVCYKCRQKGLKVNSELLCRVCFSVLRGKETSICGECLKKKAMGICPRCGNEGRLQDGDGICINCKDD